MKEDAEIEAGSSAIPPEELDRLTDGIIQAVKTVYDPEIPVDIYELGEQGVEFVNEQLQ